MHELTDGKLHQVSEDYANERPILPLPILSHRFETDVVRHQRAAQLAGALKQSIVYEPISAVVLGGQHIHLPQAQLSGNGVIDVHIEVEADGHRQDQSHKAFRA